MYRALSNEKKGGWALMRSNKLFSLLVSDIDNIGLHDEDITDIRTKELEHLLDMAVEAVKKKIT